MSAPPRVTRTDWLALAAVFVLALSLRSWGAWDSWRPDGVRITDPDACQHLRRIRQTIDNYPWTPAFDWFSNYPEGSLCPWAPLLDFGLATLALAAGLGRPERALVEQLSSCAIPVLGALAVLPVYLTGRRLFGRGAGLVAALALALLPGHVLYSLFGRVDHHVLEALFVALLLAVHLRVLAAERVRRLDSALLGGCLVLLALAWHGFPLYLAMAFAAAHVPLWAARGDAARREAVAGLHAEAFTWLFVAVVMQAGGSEYYQRGIVAYEGLSSAHLVVAGAAALYFGILAGAASNWPGMTGRLFGLTAALAGIAIAAGASRLFGSQVSALLEARRFGDIGVNQMSTEGRPLFALEGMWPGFATPIAWVLPLAAVLLVLAGEGREDRVRRGVLAVWVTGLWCAAAWMSRFVYVLSVPLALLVPALAGEVSRVLTRGARGAVVVGSVAPSAGRGRARLVVGAAVLVALLLQPVLLSVHFVTSTSWWDDDVYDVLVWLRDHTPAVTDVAEGARPEYGVVAPWWMGNHLKYVAGRPVVADNLGYGLARAARLQAVGWDRAAGDAATSRLRYMLTEGGSGPQLPAPAGRLDVRLVSPLLEDLSGEPEKNYQPGDRSYTWPGPPLSPLLHFFDGSAALLRMEKDELRITNSPHFRLANESRSAEATSLGIHVSRLKVFEFVRDATVVFRGPSRQVAIRLELVTSHGRSFVFATVPRCDWPWKGILWGNPGTGSVPYATRRWNGSVHAPGPCEVRGEDGKLLTTFDVTEEDVQEGRTIEVALPE